MVEGEFVVGSGVDEGDFVACVSCAVILDVEQGIGLRESRYCVDEGLFGVCVEEVGDLEG
ncbi:hypothetical protein CK510_19895 [Brunnivagina elsteri CCALA 953]|uniref:Uncharacterized protein n=1 Tax=Brunnivagina elsteri CCALA 953 TaxID=987040 RepID=A0A2A2TF92_9CYAN|nr:hypothetical protein CK510_19895 [Calothrix elsteri CCALA 953]